MAKASEKTVEAEEVTIDAAEEALMQRSPQKIVKKYMLWSMAAGMAPVLLDTLTITALQLRLLQILAKRYNVPFSQNVGKSVIASLVGGVGSAALSRGSVGSLLKLIPVIGPVVGYVAMPSLAGATTYAIGNVFIKHFESGGTFLDFDPAKAKKSFNKLLDEGKKVATKVDGAVDSVVDRIS